MSHEIFVGKTKSGKTYLAKQKMLKSPKGVLFINYVDPERDKRFYQVDRFTDFRLIDNLLKSGRKVQYNVSVKHDNFGGEVEMLYDWMKNRGNAIICIDEVHLLPKTVQAKIANWWKVGRHRGIDAYGITQRPQELDRAMTTQSDYINIFKMSMEDTYLKTYGIDPAIVPKEVHKHVVIER